MAKNLNVGSVSVKINPGKIGEILRSSEVRADLERRAQAVKAAAGGAPGDFVVDSQTGKNRARASVRTATPRAMVLEARDRRLSSAIDAAR